MYSVPEIEHENQHCGCDECKDNSTLDLREWALSTASAEQIENENVSCLADADQTRVMCKMQPSSIDDSRCFRT